MKKGSNKGLLLSWLLDALNKKKFSGLRWHDEKEKIFYINWTHKSSENWSASEVQVYEAWAAFKGKLKNKNSKQLKATFRCALNSKKQLKEVGKSRTKRFWQFIRPESSKPNEEHKKPEVEENNRSKSLNNKLAKDDQFVTSQTNGNTSSNMSTFSENSILNVDDLLISSITSTVNGVSFSNQHLPAENCSNEKENSRLEVLPTFESTFTSSGYLTPPYKPSDNFYCVPDYDMSHSPCAENRLTPPSEIMLNFKQAFYRDDDKDSSLWRPNFLTIPKCSLSSQLVYEETNNLNYSLDFFNDQRIKSSTNTLTPMTDSIEMYDSSSFCESSARLDFLLRDVDNENLARVMEELNKSLQTRLETYSS